MQDVALTNIVITADEQYRLHLCATASAANLPPKPIIANLEFRSLIADELMNLSAVTGGEAPECNAEARRRFYAATPEQKKRWGSIVLGKSVGGRRYRVRCGAMPRSASRACRSRTKSPSGGMTVSASPSGSCRAFQICSNAEYSQ